MKILLRALIVAGSVAQLASFSAHAVESCGDTVSKMEKMKKKIAALKALLGGQSAPPVLPKLNRAVALFYAEWRPCVSKLTINTSVLTGIFNKSFESLFPKPKCIGVDQ